DSRPGSAAAPSPEAPAATDAAAAEGGRFRRPGLVLAAAALVLAFAVAWQFRSAAPPAAVEAYVVQPLTSFVGRELEPALSPRSDSRPGSAAAPSPEAPAATDGAAAEGGRFRRPGLVLAAAALVLAFAVAWQFRSAAPPAAVEAYVVQPLTSFVGRELEPALSP